MIRGINKNRLTMRKVFNSLSSSLELFFDQFVNTFSKDTAVFDKEVSDAIFNSSENKKTLLEELNQNNSQTIEISFSESGGLEIVEGENGDCN